MPDAPIISDQDLVERLRKTLTSAKRAQNPTQLEVALAGCERLLANNLEALARGFSAFAPAFTPPPTVAPFVPATDNSAEITQLIEEKFALRTQIDELHQEIADLRLALRRRDEEYKVLLAKQTERSGAYAVIDIDLVREQLDALIAPIRITPSPAMAGVLKQPNLSREFPFLTGDLANEYADCTVPAEVIAGICDILGPRASVALINNIPIDYELIPPFRALMAAMVKWRKGSGKARPWVAFPIRCGVIQDNLHRLRDADTIRIG